MSRLSDLYNAMETLRRLGLHVNKELEREVSQAEEAIIKNEILPILKQRIEPALQEVQRELVLVVDYKPGQPISVALSRKVKIGEIADATPITPHATTDTGNGNVGQPVVSEETKKAKPQDHEPTKQVTNPTKGLRVTFADGTMVCMTTAIDTFKVALQRIGLDRIHALGITHNGYNLVSHDKHPLEPGRIFQHELNGWYIYSNMSNKDKKRDLQTISERLRLNLTVEDGKPSK